MCKKLAIVVFVLVLYSSCKNSNNEGYARSVVLSRMHNICLIAPDMKIESREIAVDYDYGTITSEGGSAIQFYVSSEPGRVGYGSVVSTRALNQQTITGKDIYEETFSDGNKSLLVDGFPSGLDGKKKIHVKFYLSTDSEEELNMAKKLINAIGPCWSRKAEG